MPYQTNFARAKPIVDPYDDSWEIWKWISGYEGYYQASNWGRIKSVDRLVNSKSFGQHVRRGKILSPGVGRWGYLQVSLCKENKEVNFRVSRLVLMAFIGPCPPNCEARHYPDNDVTNNRLNNLCWSTHKANVNDRREHGTQRLGEDHHYSVLSAKQVVYIKRNYTRNAQLLANKFNVHPDTITLILKGRTWTHINVDNFVAREPRVGGRKPKLMAHQEAEIIKLAKTKSQAQIAKMFNVSQTLIHKIIHGKRSLIYRSHE